MTMASFDRSRLWTGDRARRAEAHRRTAVNLVFLIYFLAIIEGPLRKWFLPGLATPVYFLRDPFVLVLYVYCLQYRLMAFGRMGWLWIGFAYMSAIWGALPFLLDNLSFVGWALGLRTYWIYVPLAFAVAGCFRREDVERFLRWNMVLAIPYAALVIQQYNSPPDAWINQGIAGDEEAAVGLAEGILRPFGLFTYVSQNADFTASMIAMFLASLMLRDRGFMRQPIVIASALAVGSMAVLTGSRAIYFLAAAIIVVTLVGSNLMAPSLRSLKQSAAAATFVVLAATLFVSAFSDMYEAMQVRFERAADAEGSIWSRALDPLLRPLEALGSAPFFGYGIGVGTPGIARYLGLPNLIYGEGDLHRNVNELGPLPGLFFVVLRFATAIWIVLVAMAVARRGERMALPLAGYVMIPLVVGQITHSPLNAFQPWLITGMVLALWADCRRSEILRNRAQVLIN